MAERREERFGRSGTGPVSQATEEFHLKGEWGVGQEQARLRPHSPAAGAALGLDSDGSGEPLKVLGMGDRTWLESSRIHYLDRLNYF